MEAGNARLGPDAGERRRAAWAALRTGLLLGIGLMGSLDQIVFHELLQWHHFYVHATPYWQLVSDGLLHTVMVSLLLLGALRLWRDRRLLAEAGRWRPLAAGLLLGMGGFQLYDGIVDHKLLRLHQVREGVADLLPYDIAWNALGLALLLAGLLLLGPLLRNELAGRSPGRPSG